MNLIDLKKKAQEMPLSTIIILLICAALIIFGIIFSASLRGYILSLFDRFTFRGR